MVPVLAAVGLALDVATKLHLAAASASTAAARALLDMKAAVDVRDQRGRLPGDTAMDVGPAEVAELLLSAMEHEASQPARRP